MEPKAPKPPANPTSRQPLSPGKGGKDVARPPPGVEISPPPRPPAPDSTSDRPDFQSGNF